MGVASGFVTSKSRIRRVPQNYPSQLAGASVKVVITVRLLEVRLQSAPSHAFETTACS
jgi:DNA-binding transcriptional regulator/RsmH inhibitor MraZ